MGCSEEGSRRAIEGEDKSPSVAYAAMLDRRERDEERTQQAEQVAAVRERGKTGWPRGS
jgi:hypothetical protein